MSSRGSTPATEPLLDVVSRTPSESESSARSPALPTPRKSWASTTSGHEVSKATTYLSESKSESKSNPDAASSSAANSPVKLKKSKSKITPLTARMTTFCLVPDPHGGFDVTAEEVDRIFTRKILIAARSKPGYVDAVRLFDNTTGDYIVVSFWETPEAAFESVEDVDYYSASRQKLWPFVRFNMFKTEHFTVRRRILAFAIRSTHVHALARAFSLLLRFWHRPWLSQYTRILTCLLVFCEHGHCVLSRMQPTFFVCHTHDDFSFFLFFCCFFDTMHVSGRSTQCIPPATVLWPCLRTHA